MATAAIDFEVSFTVVDPPAADPFETSLVLMHGPLTDREEEVLERLDGFAQTAPTFRRRDSRRNVETSWTFGPGSQAYLLALTGLILTEGRYWWSTSIRPSRGQRT